MAKGKSKKAYHREGMRKVNRTALTIGGVVAVVSLVVIVVSFIKF